MAEILSKSEYARHAGVKPAAVSNWIARQRLTAPALRPDGKIDRDAADRQLGRTINVLQSAAKRTPGRTEAPAPGNPDTQWGPRDQAATQLLRARALSASVAAERARRELNVERGRYVLIDQAAAEWGKALGEFLRDVEQSLPDLAIELALDQEAKVALRRWWRNQRAKTAAQHATAAAGEPEFMADSAA